MKTLGFGRKAEAAGDAFTFANVADVDDATARAFFETTHERARQMPLLIARHVFDALARRLTEPGRMDALELSEIRGGMQALRAFGVAYTRGVAEWTAAERRNRSRDRDGGAA